MSTTQPTPPETVDGARVDPDRLLFISMLTRDIELIPAILDLWDNSIDGAKRFSGGADGDLDGFTVDIDTRGGRFSIRDNCGGITVEDARNRAFRLGRPRDLRGATEAAGQPGVGIFGVGMKRALFKLGRQFRVESESVAGSFALEVVVDDWAEEGGPWSFPFETVDERTTADPRDGSTDIVVTSLFESIAVQLDDEGFERRLAHELATRRYEAFRLGVVTRLNGKPVAPFRPQLRHSGQMPAVVRRLTPVPGVDVTIRAGVVGEAASTTLTIADEGDGSKWKGTADRAGWYVRANGRVLLAEDTSPTTGWGDGVAKYHPQYRDFRGYVDITALDGSLLPWNTTKTGVDEDSPVWRRTYAVLRDALVDGQTIINRLKEERTDELAGSPAGPVTAAVRAAPLVDVDAIDASGDSKLKLPKAPGGPRPRSISFSVPRAEFDEVADSLGVKTAKDVGQGVFDYYRDVELGS